MVHGALLAVRGNSKHEQELKEHAIRSIDMVVVNLYPFQATVDKVGSCVRVSRFSACC